jgi:hypothetical protein
MAQTPKQKTCRAVYFGIHLAAAPGRPRTASELQDVAGTLGSPAV